MSNLEDLLIEEIEIGTGKEAKAGNRIRAHYTGMLKDGTVFDSSHNRGTPLTFTLGIGQVIKGWDDGLQGMLEGGKRKLTIPSHLGYGAHGAGALIPPHATLIFDVELVEVL
jgi:peptidylprolyl isomerase